MLRIFVLISFFVLGACAWGPTTALVSVPTTPVGAGSTVQASKTGEAVCWNILGIAAWGDCGVEAAKKAGGINEIATIDQQNLGILGLFYKTTIIVKGN